MYHGPPITIDFGDYKKTYYDTVSIQMRSDGDGEVKYTAEGQYNIINKCDSCHRFDVEEKVLHSLDEVIAAGWLVPVEEKKEE